MLAETWSSHHILLSVADMPPFWKRNIENPILIYRWWLWDVLKAA